MTVRYSSDHPGTVRAQPSGSLRALAPGPATISYRGRTVTGAAVVYVENS